MSLFLVAGKRAFVLAGRVVEMRGQSRKRGEGLFAAWYVWKAVLWALGGVCLVLFRKKIARHMHSAYTKSWSFAEGHWYTSVFKRSEVFFMTMMAITGVLVASAGLGRLVPLILTRVLRGVR